MGELEADTDLGQKLIYTQIHPGPASLQGGQGPMLSGLEPL